MIASAESTAQHPIGSAIVRMLRCLQAAMPPAKSDFAKVTNPESLPGYGMSCDVTVVPHDCPPGPELPRPPQPHELGASEVYFDYDAAHRMELDFYSVNWNANTISEMSWAGGFSA